MPVFRVTVTRAFMTGSFPLISISCDSPARAYAATNLLRFRGSPWMPKSYAQSDLMDRGRRLLEQLPTARHMAALTDEPHRGPERRRRAGDDRQPVAIFERLGDTERAQPAAGDQDGLGAGRVRHRLS